MEFYFEFCFENGKIKILKNQFLKLKTMFIFVFLLLTKNLNTNPNGMLFFWEQGTLKLIKVPTT